MGTHKKQHRVMFWQSSGQGGGNSELKSVEGRRCLRNQPLALPVKQVKAGITQVRKKRRKTLSTFFWGDVSSDGTKDRPKKLSHPQATWRTKKLKRIPNIFTRKQLPKRECMSQK